jgi:hypothetical protein
VIAVNNAATASGLRTFFIFRYSFCCGAECTVGHTDQPSLFIEGFRFLVASRAVRDLLLSAKHLFGAANRVRSAMGLPGPGRWWCQRQPWRGGGESWSARIRRVKLGSALANSCLRILASCSFFRELERARRAHRGPT